MPTEANPKVQGQCPACKAESLFLGDGGYVTCSVLGCETPTAAGSLLERSYFAWTLLHGDALFWLKGDPLEGQKNLAWLKGLGSDVPSKWSMAYGNRPDGERVTRHISVQIGWTAKEWKAITWLDDEDEEPTDAG